MVCTFISPPKWGAAREVHHSWASRRSRVLTIPDHQVEGSFWWEGGFQHLWDPCGCVGDLPSAKRFPLSRSKNTKLGIPGAPLPGLPNPIPALPPGWPS